MDRLLNPNRIVYIERTLWYPEDKKTYESMSYWLSQMMVSTFATEPNTKSVRIKEIDNV